MVIRPLTHPQLLAPLSADILFTVGILIVSDVFPAKTQALAGAVFNTLAQLGTSIGLTTLSVISRGVTKEIGNESKGSSAALMEGYRASCAYSLGYNIYLRHKLIISNKFSLDAVRLDGGCVCGGRIWAEEAGEDRREA